MLFWFHGQAEKEEQAAALAHQHEEQYPAEWGGAAVTTTGGIADQQPAPEVDWASGAIGDVSSYDLVVFVRVGNWSCCTMPVSVP